MSHLPRRTYAVAAALVLVAVDLSVLLCDSGTRFTAALVTNALALLVLAGWYLQQRRRRQRIEERARPNRWRGHEPIR